MFDLIKRWRVRRQLRKNGYAVIRGFLSPEIVELSKCYLDMTLFHADSMRMREQNDKLKGDVVSFNGDPFQDSLLLYYRKEIEKYFDVDEAIPSYIYFREYMKGSSLAIHRDREECQFSVSFTISIRGEGENLLVFCDDEQGTNPVAIDTREGDAILFMGASKFGGRWHYRPESKLDSLVQVFMHYVSSDNPADQPFPRPFYRSN